MGATIAVGSCPAALGEESEDGRQIRRRARAMRQMMMSGRCVSARLAQLRLGTKPSFYIQSYHQQGGFEGRVRIFKNKQQLRFIKKGPTEVRDAPTKPGRNLNARDLARAPLPILLCDTT